jgi:CubicO group peptidase (beta-lactamase class C family)
MIVGQEAGIESVDAAIDRTLAVNTSRLGTTYTVTPESYLAIGRAIEQVVGAAIQPVNAEAEGEVIGMFSPLVNGRLLRPLGIGRTVFNPPQNRHALATGHTEYGTPYIPGLRPLRPAGPVYASAADLGRLLEYLLGAPVPGIDQRARISDSSLDAMYTTGLAEHPMGFGFGYGLGVKVIASEFGRAAEVSSVDRGLGALMRWYPDHGCGVVVLFNSDTGLDAARRIAHEALGGV